jgi:hypothetical protein
MSPSALASIARRLLNGPGRDPNRYDILALVAALEQFRLELALERLKRQRAESIAKTVYRERTTS